jgi:hypothetical protein
LNLYDYQVSPAGYPKAPTAVVGAAGQQAWADDRSLSAYLRKIITDPVRHADDDESPAADRDAVVR